MIPISQLEEMKQHIDASAKGAIKNRLRIKADAEFEKELYQLISHPPNISFAYYSYNP